MGHIFLSYAREDVERAKRLAGALEAHGFSVWWDRTIPPGKTFDQVIEEALEQAEKVVVLWSASALASHWVRTEAEVALERGVLVPVLIEDVLPPFSSRRIEAAELQRWTGDPNDPELQNLVAALGGTGHAPSRPAAGREPEPEPAPPAPRPHRRGRRLAWALAAAAVLLVAGIGAVALLGRLVGPEPVPVEPWTDDGGEEAVPYEGQDDAYSEKLDLEPAAPSAPPGAAITLRYTGDPYGCQLNLSFDVGGRQFAPDSPVYVLSDLPEGPTPYAITGLIACPTIGSCTVFGSGTLPVRDGAAYNLVWQNTAYAQCQATLVDGSLD